MDPQQLQLNDIALFVEVARRKSFSLAARALAMPTSTLSRRISHLETVLGLRLINRNTRRLELTDAGASYFRRCQGLVDEARVAHEQLHTLSARPQGRLNIAIPYSIAIWLLPEALKAFTERYPDLECNFDLGIKAVESADGAPFDLILRFGRPTSGAEPATSQDAVIHEIASLSTRLYASAPYLEKHGEPQQPSDLADHECFRTAIEPEHSYWILHRGDHTQRVAVKGALAGNSISVMGTLAGLGLGITRLPDCRALAPIIANNGLKPILADWHLERLSLYAEFPAPIIPAKTRAFMAFLQPWLEPA